MPVRGEAVIKVKIDLTGADQFTFDGAIVQRLTVQAGSDSPKSNNVKFRGVDFYQGTMVYGRLPYRLLPAEAREALRAAVERARARVPDGLPYRPTPG